MQGLWVKTHTPPLWKYFRFKIQDSLFRLSHFGFWNPLPEFKSQMQITFYDIQIYFHVSQAEVLQAIYKEYTFDEFLDFSNSTFEMNWNVNNLLAEIQNVSGKLKVSYNFFKWYLFVTFTIHFKLWVSPSLCTPQVSNSNLVNIFFSKNSVEGPLDAAAREHGELVKQLKETEAIAELLKRLYKVKVNETICVPWCNKDRWWWWWWK